METYSVKVDGYTTLKDSSGKPYTAYALKVKKGDDRSWTIFKRFSEFHAFNKKLSINYSSSKFHLPSKMPLKNNSTMVETRRQKLENFMDHVLNHPQVRISDLLSTFLEPELNLSCQEISKECQHSGSLMVISQSKKPLARAKAHWMVLHNNRLYFYPSYESEKPAGSLNVSHSNLINYPEKAHSFQLTALDGTKLIAQCVSQESYNEWTNILRETSGSGRRGTTAIPIQSNNNTSSTPGMTHFSKPSLSNTNTASRTLNFLLLDHESSIFEDMDMSPNSDSVSTVASSTGPAPPRNSTNQNVNDQISTANSTLKIPSSDMTHMDSYIGKSLSQIMSRPDHANLQVPTLVSKVLEYLKTHDSHLQEGIFRLSGGKAQIDKYAEMFNKNQPVDLSGEEDANVCTGLLTYFFREMPDPILTFELYDKFLAVGQCQDLDTRYQALWTLVHQLPPESFHTAKLICEYLKYVSQFKETNKMGCSNLAAVVRSNFMRPKVMNAQNMFSQVPAGIAVTQTLIEDYEYFFLDPDEQKGDEHVGDETGEESSHFLPIDPNTEIPEGGLWTRATFDYQTDSEGELPFFAGDKILITERIPESNWWPATLNGTSGLVPLNYIELLPEDEIPDPDAAEEDSSSQQDTEDDSESKSKRRNRKAITQSVMFSTPGATQLSATPGSPLKSPTNFRSSRIMPTNNRRASTLLGSMGTKGGSGIMLRHSPTTGNKAKGNQSQVLIRAAKNGSDSLVKQIIDEGAISFIDAKDETDGRTALYWAARNGHVAVVKLLAEAGANTNVPDERGGTPLCAGARNETITDILLQNGADPNKGNKWGWAPLHIAAFNETPKVVKLLVNHPKTNLTLPTKKDVSGIKAGSSPFDVATVRKSGVSAKIITEAIASRQGQQTAAKLAAESAAAPQVSLGSLVHQLTELNARLAKLEALNIEERLDRLEKLVKNIK